MNFFSTTRSGLLLPQKQRIAYFNPFSSFVKSSFKYFFSDLSSVFYVSLFSLIVKLNSHII